MYLRCASSVFELKVQYRPVKFQKEHLDSKTRADWIWPLQESLCSFILRLLIKVDEKSSKAASASDLKAGETIIGLFLPEIIHSRKLD